MVPSIAMSDHWCWASTPSRDFDLLAKHEPGEDILRAGVKIRSQECLRIELAFGIANEKPADRHWRNTGAIPERGSGGDLDHDWSGRTTADAAALPGDFRILENCGKLSQSFALDRRSVTAFALGGGSHISLSRACWRRHAVIFRGRTTNTPSGEGGA
jgi:hypothetical protein